jgi:hypothetical protein
MLPRSRPAIHLLLASVTLLAIGSLATAQQATLQPATPVTTPAPAATPAATASPTPGVVRHGLKAPKPRTPGTIRIASYNIENLFDDKDDPALSGEQDDKDMTKPLAHRQAAAAAIKALDADIIAMQEIESLEALTWFRDNHLKGLGYDHIVSIDSGDGRGIECSVLSRFPLKDAKVFKDMPLGGTHPDKWGNEANREAGKPITFRRSPLQVTVEVPADKAATFAKAAGALGTDAAANPKPYEVTLFVIHFKSGRPGAYWREAESRKTLELAADLLKTSPDCNIIITGDFNSQKNEEPLAILYRAGWHDIFADRNPKDTETMTHSSDRAIDHMLFSTGLSGELVFDSRFVLGTITRPAGVDWRTTPPPDNYCADHYPVAIDLYPFERPATDKIPQHRTPVKPAAADDVQHETPPAAKPASRNANPKPDPKK